jgi:hypothetical protein
MKVSLYIDLWIGAEIFPSFPYFPALQHDQARPQFLRPCYRDGNTPDARKGSPQYSPRLLLFSSCRW